MSTNINVQVSNSYKKNLKVIKCKWTIFTICIDRLMLKAITLFRLRAVSDFLFAFCSLINIVVSGAGVVHYHLLHRPRSVPTALGPAPLATNINEAPVCH